MMTGARRAVEATEAMRTVIASHPGSKMATMATGAAGAMTGAAATGTMATTMMAGTIRRAIALLFDRHHQWLEAAELARGAHSCCCLLQSAPRGCAAAVTHSAPRLILRRQMQCAPSACAAACV